MIYLNASCLSVNPAVWHFLGGVNSSRKKRIQKGLTIPNADSIAM
jgi:hypothetical protein